MKARHLERFVWPGTLTMQGMPTLSGTPTVDETDSPVLTLCGTNVTTGVACLTGARRGGSKAAAALYRAGRIEGGGADDKTKGEGRGATELSLGCRCPESERDIGGAKVEGLAIVTEGDEGIEGGTGDVGGVGGRLIFGSSSFGTRGRVA